MRQRSSSLRLALITLIGIVLGSAGGVAQQPSFAGTWHLNVAKSTYRPGPAPKSGVLNVQYKGTTRHSVLDTIAANGDKVRTEYAAVENGQDYPLKGSPNADTVSLRRSSPGTIERVDKRQGQTVMFLVLRLSQDGKTMTVTQQGVTASGDKVSNTIVYEKR